VVEAEGGFHTLVVVATGGAVHGCVEEVVVGWELFW
jgi:hypothetical protein